MEGPLLLGAPLDPFHVSKFYIRIDRFNKRHASQILRTLSKEGRT